MIVKESTQNKLKFTRKTNNLGYLTNSFIDKNIDTFAQLSRQQG